MISQLLTEKGLVNQIGGLNYNFRVAQRGPAIAQDIQALLQKMDIRPQILYSGQQVHGAHVAYADGQNGEDNYCGKQFPETDGLITDKAGVALLIKFADCTPVVLYDPVAQVQAVVHSGWRSTQKRISQIALLRMVDEFGADLGRILAYLGPSIDQANYRVGPEVYEAFAGFKNRDDFFIADQGDRYLMSMTDANLSILREAGLKDSQIEVNRQSTFLSDRLHSARREGADYGLNGIITMIPEKISTG